MPPPAKSQNVCTGCRSRKKKCSGERPACATCLKRGDLCMYAGAPLQGLPRAAAPQWLPGEDLYNFQAIDDSNLLATDMSDWMQPANEVQMNDWIEPLDQGQPTEGSRESSHSSQQSNSTRQSSTSSNIPVILPEEELLTQLVELFFTKFYHFLPILHKATILSRVSSRKNDECRLLLFAIIAVTAGSHPDRQVRALQETWFAEAKQLFLKAAHTADHPLQTLQAANLLIFHNFMVAEYSTAWMMLGEAWQKAVATGCSVLDGPPQLTLRGLGSISSKSWPDAEECRRNVWMFFIFDRSMCFPMGLNHAIDDRRLRINLPLSDEHFQRPEAPQNETPIAFHPNMDRLIESIRARNQKERMNPLHYVMLGYIFLGNVTDRIFSVDEEDREVALDKLSSQLTTMRLTLPAAAGSFCAAEPEHFTYVSWVNVVWNACGILLNHRSLQLNELLNKESTMAMYWPRCVVSARNTVSMVREAAEISTNYIINPHDASLMFVCARILIVEYACPFEPHTDNQKNVLFSDIKTLLFTFERMKDVFESVGRKFRNGLIFYLKLNEDDLLESKAGGSRDVLKTCDKWPDFKNEDLALTG